MRVIKPFALGLLYRVFEARNRFNLSIGLSACFDFDSAAGLIGEIDMWKFVAEDLGKDVKIDDCMPKLRGEALVFGKAFSRGKPLPAMEVGFNLGPVSKRLAVFGDRYWKRGFITDPVPFTAMPITWENAFGGPDFERNPSGKGAMKVAVGPDLLLPLPNIEDPKKLIGLPADRPDPAGFRPLEIQWPQRAKKAGTYNDVWLRTRFPGYADDIDWTIFNTAPPDQWAPEYFTGDERFSFLNLHPTKAVVEGALPAIRPRCFIETNSGGGKNFRELPLRVETILFFPHVEKGIVIYRTAVEIGTDDASDIEHLVVGYERRKDPPRTTEHYADVIRLMRDAFTKPELLLDESPLIPAGEKSAFDDVIEKGLQEAKSNKLTEHLKKRAEREMAKKDEILAQLGIAAPPAPPPPPVTDPTIDDVKNISAIADKAWKDAMATREQQLAGMREQMAKLGVDLDKVMEEAKKKLATGRPNFAAEEKIAQFRAMGINRPELEEKIRLADKVLRENYIRFAQFTPEIEPIPPEKNAALRQAVSTGVKSGQSFAGADLLGVDLSNLDLRGADFSNCFIEQADFTGSDLTGANFSGAVLTRARFVRARVSDANFTGANLGVATLTQSEFNRSVFNRAVFFQAQITDSVFDGASFLEAQFMEAKFAGANFSNARFGQLNFFSPDLSGCNFSGADLTMSVFLQGKAIGADFSGATMVSVVFMEMDLRDAKFVGANASRITAINKVDLSGADFSRASVERSGFLEINLAGAKFPGAKADKTIFMKCDLKGADFSRASGQMARFDRADLTGAKMAGINLMMGSLLKARLVGADLRAANLYGCEVLRAVIGETRFDRANLKMTKLKDWRPS